LSYAGKHYQISRCYNLEDNNLRGRDYVRSWSIEELGFDSQ
jgi:hypothetical protein